MKLSKRVDAIEASLTRHLFNLAKNYDDVIDLTLGDPDLPPSQTIMEAACDAIKKGKIRYSANAGLMTLREVLAERFRAEYGISVNPAANIAVTVGGMEALFLALQALVDEGDEVIVLAPYYVNYKQMIALNGGVCVIADTLEADGFVPRIEEIEKKISDKTVALILNTPCNPTGSMIPKETLDEISRLAKKYDLAVISDEVYRTLVYDGKKHASIVNCDGMQERTVVVDSLSKRFAMTGYRIGYAVASETVIAAMTKLQENVAACAPVSSQYAAIAAFEQCGDEGWIREEFEKRRDYIVSAINEIDGISCRCPEATFYLFVNVEKTGLDGLNFAYRLLEQEHVAVVPGVTYGASYGNYIRIAYTMNVECLKKAVKRIERFVRSLQEKKSEDMK